MIIPFRDENKNHIPPFITVGLILVNIIIYLVFLLVSKNGEYSHLYRIFGSIPYELIKFKSSESIIGFERPFPFFFTLISSLFVHTSTMHLLGNMLYLWIFGRRIEDYLGHVKFILFYIVAGVISSYFHAFINYYGFLPEIFKSSPFTPCVGASGVIAGCMGAYLMKYPKAIIDFLFIFIVLRIRAYWFLIFWIVGQLLNVMPIGGETSDNTAWFAHIGGFIGGILLIKLFQIVFRIQDEVAPIDNEIKQ